jgi:hypothetical protein
MYAKSVYWGVLSYNTLMYVLDTFYTFCQGVLTHTGAATANYRRSFWNTALMVRISHVKNVGVLSSRLR